VNHEPGWYADPHNTEGRMFFVGHDGKRMDPFVQFEEHAAESLIPVLEQVFEAGFEAGIQTAAKLHGITSML
jgi:hypothetical protein